MKKQKAPKPPADLRSETQISKEIVDALRAMGLYAVRVNAGMVAVRRGFLHLAPKGTPDVFVCVRGVFQTLEVKRPGEDQEPDQIEAQKDIERAGGRYAVVRSLDDALVACGLRGP